MRLQSVAAVLLLQVNLALAVEPGQSQAAPATPQTTQIAPEAPAPVASSPAPTLAQTMRQQERSSFAPQTPTNLPMPHSRNPIARYRASAAPELDLNNSPRLQNLIREGKLYLSMRDAIALAIENNLDLAYFRYNFPSPPRVVLALPPVAEAARPAPDSPPARAVSLPQLSVPEHPFRPSIPSSPSKALSTTKWSRSPISSRSAPRF